MAKVNDRPGNDWFSKAEICRFQGIAEQTFDKTYRSVVPPASVRKTGSRTWYHGPGYLAAAKAKWVADATPAGGSDPMLEGGGDSPWLERYREQKTRLSMMEADERQKLTVRTTVIEPVLLNSLATIRQSLERVEREFGREAARPVLEAIDDAIDAIGKHFADGNTRTGVAGANAAVPQAAAPPDHAGIRGS